MSILMRRVLPLSCLLWGLAASTQAAPVSAGGEVLYDNLGNAESGVGLSAASVNAGFGDAPIGASFMTGNSTAVTDIKLLMMGGGDDGGSILVSIWDDIFDSPASDLGLDLTIPDGALDSSGFGVLNIPVSVSGLSQNTQYWVVVSDAGGDNPDNPAPTSAQWSLANDSTGINVDGGWYFSDGESYSNDLSNPDSPGPGNIDQNTAFQMCVVGNGEGKGVCSEPPVPSPEPFSLSIVGVALAGLGVVRWRRKA